MTALLLAAGIGSRLDPLTRLLAKPAVPLGERPLAEHVLTWLRTQGIRDVVVNLHHLPATVASALGDGAHLDMSIRYSWEPAVLGSAGGPRRALPLLESDPFLIVNGDTLCDFDLAPMLDAHTRSGADVTMAVVTNPEPGHYNGILADDDGVVTGVIPRGHAVPSWHFVGVQLVAKSVFSPLQDGVPTETVAGLYQELIRTSPGRIRTWPVSTSFMDIGTPRDYLAAALRHAGSLPAVLEVPASSDLTRCAVWPGVEVEEHVRLEDCIVAGPLRVPCGLDTSAAILVPASVALPGDRMHLHGDVAIYSLDIGHARN